MKSENKKVKAKMTVRENEYIKERRQETYEL